MPVRPHSELARDALRRRILDAAKELFTTHPFDAVTLRPIAERAGCTAPTILNHFGSKEGLLFAVCEEVFRALRARFGRIAKVADPVERLEKIGLAYVEFAMEHPNDYRFMFMTPHPVPDPEDPVDRPEQPRPGRVCVPPERRWPRRSRPGGSARAATTPTWSPRSSGAGSTGWCRSTSTRGTTPVCRSGR